MKGPLVKFQYKPNMKKKIGMVRPGSHHMSPRSDYGFSPDAHALHVRCMKALHEALHLCWKASQLDARNSWQPL